MESFTRCSATALAAMIREGKATSVAITQAYLQRIRACNDQYHALVSVFEKEALAIARLRDEEAAAGHWRGSLHGVPVTIKESFWMKDARSTMNARYFKNFKAREDAELVRRFREAGAVILGQTNVPALLLDYQVNGELFPATKNPFNPAYSPGGSTGGGAAALALGMTSLELGSDFGGSILVPAAFCGLYGLKPTEGSLSTHGIVPVPAGIKQGKLYMVQAGPLARCPEDIELCWRILKGADANSAEQTPGHTELRSLAGCRVAWVDGWPGYPVCSVVSSALQDWMKELAAAGCQVYKPEVPEGLHRASLEVFVGLFPFVVAQGAPWWVRLALRWQLERGLLRGMRARYLSLSNRLREGFSLNKHMLQEVLLQRQELTRRWESFLQEYDVLVCPLAYGPPYRRGKTGSPLSYEGHTMPYCDYVWPYSACFNASGHPAISVPLGFSAEGLPVGVQVVGRYGSESELIRFAMLAGKRALEPAEDCSLTG